MLSALVPEYEEQAEKGLDRYGVCVCVCARVQQELESTWQ